MRTHRTSRLTALVASLAITACGGSSGTDAPAKSGDGDATLAGLAVSAGALSPAFASAVTSYALVAPHGTATLTVTPTAASAAAHVTLTMDGGTPVAVASGSASAALAVPAEGSSAALSLVVTAEDGVTQKTYGVTLTQAPSSDARLAGLAVSAGSLSPTFATGTLVYALVVPFGTASVTLTPAAADSAATVAVSLDGGAASPLVGGQVTVAVPAVGASQSVGFAVTAPDALTTRTYAVTLTQAPSTDASLAALAVDAGALSPAFAPGTTGYVVVAPHGATTLGVTPTVADASATVTVSQDGGTPAAVASGATASVAVPPVGTSSTVTVLVTAQDGTTIRTYTVVLSQDPGNDAALSALTLNGTSPLGFSPSTLGYAFGVPNGAPTVAVVATPRDPLASSVSVNGQPGNGGASVPVALAAGAATVTVVVTAHDGVTQTTYTVDVSEAPPTGLVNARAVPLDPSPLLTVEAGALLPASAATGVPVDTLLRIGFDAAPVLGTAGAVTIRRVADDAVVDRIDLADSWAVYDGTASPKGFTTNCTSSRVNVIGNVTSGIDQVRVVNYVPVTISGNTAVIFPHNNKLSYGVAYYVTIDPGVLIGTVGGIPFGGIATSGTWSFATKPAAPSGTLLHVAADGSADFATVQGAIDAVPVANRTATTLSVAPGVYQELLWIRNKWNLTIQGTDGVGTVIQYDNCDGFNPGTGGGQGVTGGTIPNTNRASGGRAVLLVASTDGLVLDTITLKNTHEHRAFVLPDGTAITATSSPTFVHYSSGVTQAETVYFNAGNASQRLVAKHANFLSRQDTLQVKGFSWFYDCFVAGDVDFVWGNANAALFERCELRTRYDTTGPSLVQSRAVSGYPGFVFLASALTRDDGPGYDAYLARSPGLTSSGYDAVAFVGCSQDPHIDALGWNASGSNPTGSNQAPSAVAGWREYRSRLPSGDFVDVSGRLPSSSALGNGSIQLLDADAGTFFSSRAAVFGCTNNGTIGWIGYGTTTGTCPGPSCTCSGWNPVP